VCGVFFKLFKDRLYLIDLETICLKLQTIVNINAKNQLIITKVQTYSYRIYLFNFVGIKVHVFVSGINSLV